MDQFILFSLTISNRSVILCYSGLGISFQNLILLHFDQIISLKSLSINLFLLARLNLGLQLMRLRVQASQRALCSEREREKERERKKAVYTVSEHICLHCVAGKQLFKQCCNLTAGHCVAEVQLFRQVETYLLALCCRGAAV